MGWRPRLPCTSECRAHPPPHSILLSLGWGPEPPVQVTDQTGVGEGILIMTRAPICQASPHFLCHCLSHHAFGHRGCHHPAADPRGCLQDHGASAQVSGSLPGQDGRRGRGLAEPQLGSWAKEQAAVGGQGAPAPGPRCMPRASLPGSPGTQLAGSGEVTPGPQLPPEGVGALFCPPPPCSPRG